MRLIGQVVRVSLETVRKALQSANANLAKGSVSNDKKTVNITDTDQIFKAYEYQPLIIAGHAGSALRLQDVSQVLDSLEDTRNLGLAGGQRSVILAVFRQPGANMIATVNRILPLLPLLRASISPSLHLNVLIDRTITIRSSVHDVEVALIAPLSGPRAHACSHFRFSESDRVWSPLPFLAAGVDNVIAARWQVEDAAARALLGSMTSWLLTSTPAEALRNAMITRSNAGAPIRDWAGFVAVGAGNRLIG